MASPGHSTSEDYKLKGNDFFNQSRFPEAIEQYSKAIDSDRGDGILYSNRSVAYMKLGDFEKALKDACRCIQLKPQWAKGYLRKVSALEGLGGRPAEIMGAATDGFKVTGEGKIKRDFVGRWFKANQELYRLPAGSIELPRGIFVLSKEYLNVLFHLFRSLDGEMPLSQEAMQLCLFCCAEEMEKVLLEFGEPVSEDMKEWAKYLSCDIFPYPSLGITNKKELEAKMEDKTKALVGFIKMDIDPALYPLLRPIMGLVVLVVIGRTNVLSNTNASHQSAEFMNRYLLPLFEENSILHFDDFHGMYVGRLCAILDSFIGRGYSLDPTEITLVKSFCLKIETALRKYSKDLSVKDKETARQALHNVKHNILLPSGSAPAPPPEGSPMSTEVARVMVKQKPAEVKSFLVQRLKTIESLKFLTMEDVEELITMSGIFYELSEQESFVNTFNKGEQAFFKVFGHLLQTNALRLDECSSSIVPIRQLTLTTAALLIKDKPDVFANIMIRWKSLFSEFRMLLIRQGMGSVLFDFFQWYMEMKTSSSACRDKCKAINDILLEHMDKEKELLLGLAVPTLNILSQQTYTSVQECLGEGEAVLDYIFFTTLKENSLLDAYCVFFENTGPPIICAIDFTILHRLAGILSAFLTKERKEDKLVEGRIKLDMISLAQVVFPQPLHDILTSGRVSHLYISPDRDLSQLPLDSLPLSGDINATPQTLLSGKMGVSILSSSREILRQITTDHLLHCKSDQRISAAKSEPSPQNACCIFASPNFDLHKAVDQYSFGGFIETFCKIFNISSEIKLAKKLQHSKEEAEFISFCLEIAGFSVKSFLEDQATLSNIMAVDCPLVLHISSHASSERQVSTFRGNFFTDLDSAILLAGCNTFLKQEFDKLVPEAGIGMLPALAVYSMNLNGTRLVFLSTCDSASGTSHAQESLSNLVEPFLAAGAETVVATLWSVGDEPAAEFCKYFYDKLREPGIRPSQALSYAKQSMDSDQLSLLCSTHGAFVCYGLDRPLVN